MSAPTSQGAHRADPPASPPLGERGAPALWGMTRRSLAIGILIVILNNWWLSQSEMRSRQTLISGTSPFIGVVFIMFVLALLNWGVRRVWRSAALSQAELLIVYVMATISSCVGGVGAMGWFPGYLVSPFWMGFSDAKWTRFHQFLPHWVGPRSKEILTPFYEGHSTLFTAAHLKAWALPLALWGLFFFVLLLVTLCMASLVRRQWVENERLTFPIVYLPVELTRMEPGGFLANRMMWAGFAIPTVIHSLNSLNAVYLTIPTATVNRGVDIGAKLVTAPWNAVSELTIRFHPSVLGIGYLLSLDVSLSCWLFFVLTKLAQVWGAAVGLRPPQKGIPDEALVFPYVNSVAIGAWMTFAGLALYGMRGHLAQVWRRAVLGDRSVDDSNEALSYRAALLGIVAGVAFLLVFCALSGLGALMPVLALGIFFLVMLALSRIRAEAGIPASELAWINPQDFVVNLIGAKSFDQRQLTALATLGWFNRDYRTAAMPAQLEALKAGQMARMRLRPVAMAMIVASFVAIVAAMLFAVNLYYNYGAETGKTYPNFVNAGKSVWGDGLVRWLDSPKPFNATRVTAASVGGGVLILFYGLRTRFVGFPLNPAAYCFAYSYTMKYFWFDFFVAWVVKGLILRYGGMKIYRKAMPLFLGLILGEFVTSSFWTIVGAVSGHELYRTFPN